MRTVFAQAKLLNLKQITTKSSYMLSFKNCICTSKVTKFKANNNFVDFHVCELGTVFAQAKLLNLKQITTSVFYSRVYPRLYLHKQSY